jgi:2-methylcitrate dehydratase PrpD
VFDSVAAATIVQTLILGHDLTTDDIASITINMSDKEAHVVDNRDMPAVNLQYLIAVMILDGMESFTSADDEARIDD